MPDESKNGHEKDTNLVNGDHKDNPPSETDKNDPPDTDKGNMESEIIEKADAAKTKNMRFK